MQTLKILLLIFSITIIPGSINAENSNFEKVVNNYQFKEMIDYCKYKHHGSYENITNEYNHWYSDNEQSIELGLKDLEKEAATDPIKAKKLPMFETYVRSRFQQVLLELPSEESAPMCFFENVARSMFD